MQLTEAQLLERRIWRHFSKGLTQYHLLDDDDHILLGLSGGKDSLALLDFMARRARIHRPKLTLTALHVRIYRLTRIYVRALVYVRVKLAHRQK